MAKEKIMKTLDEFAIDQLGDTTLDYHTIVQIVETDDDEYPYSVIETRMVSLKNGKKHSTSTDETYCENLRLALMHYRLLITCLSKQSKKSN